MASPSAEAAAAVPARSWRSWLSGPYTQETRRDQLDGLRCFLYLCVFTVHHELDRVEYLTYSLSTFFVMSGFLITRVLWMCKADTLWGKLKIFYVRRVIRIVPAYAFVVALLLIFDHLENPYAYVFYYLNIKVFLVSLHQELPAFITWWSNWDRQDLHLWSMSVEEQFYLLFPWVYFLVPARHYGKTFIAAVIFGVATRTWFMHYYPMSFYGFLLSSCVEYFAWGAFFSYLDLSGRMPAKPSPWWSLYLPVAITIGLISIEYGFDFDGYYHQRTSQFLGIIAPFLGLSMWGLWVADGKLAIVRFLNWKPFVYFGQISYPMYLTHLTFIVFCHKDLAPYILPLVGGSERWQYVVSFVLAFIMNTMAGAFIWHFIEVPASRLKRRFPLDPARALRRAAAGAANTNAAPQPG